MIKEMIKDKVVKMNEVCKFTYRKEPSDEIKNRDVLVLSIVEDGFSGIDLNLLSGNDKAKLLNALDAFKVEVTNAMKTGFRQFKEAKIIQYENHSFE